MNKDQALARLAQVEAETAALRKIIEAPEKAEGLWRPNLYSEYYGLDQWGDSVRCVNEAKPEHGERHLDNLQWLHGNCFQTAAIAEKASPLMARANKIIAAALQADPDAGVHSSERFQTVLFRQGKWIAESWGHDADYSTTHPVHVHTVPQAEEWASILNAEGVK